MSKPPQASFSFLCFFLCTWIDIEDGCNDVWVPVSAKSQRLQGADPSLGENLGGWVLKTVSSGSSDSWPAAGCCLNRFQPEAVNGFNDDVQRLLLCKSSDSFLYMLHLGQPINHFFSSEGWQRKVNAGGHLWLQKSRLDLSEGVWIIQKSDFCVFFLRSMCHPQIAWFSQTRCVPVTFGSWGFVSCNFDFVFEVWHFWKTFLLLVDDYRRMAVDQCTLQLIAGWFFDLWAGTSCEALPWWRWW